MGQHQIIEEDIKRIETDLSEFKSSIKDKTFLVTGGAGFLGSWFCDVAHHIGANVICVDNLVSGSLKNIQHLLKEKNFKFVREDASTYSPTDTIDYIVHMASIASPPLYMKYPIETLETNSLGTKRLLELAKKNNCKAILFMSTSEIYGDPSDKDIPTSENFLGVVNSFGPRSIYDEGKRVGETYCYTYYHTFKVPVRISRTFNTYGPKLDVKSTSQYGRALIKFLNQALHNEPITVYGDGKQSRSFCYVTDQITGLFKLLLTPGLDGQVFNVGNEKEYSVNELAKMIIKITKSKSKVVQNSPPNYDLKNDPRRRCPNINKAKTSFGYKTVVALEEGLKRTSSWAKDAMQVKR